MSEILHLSNVSRHFSGLQALRDVTRSVNKGEVLGLIGPNGAGKTTLVNTICGVTPASSGVVTFDGKDITRVKTYQAARLGLSRTFQIVQPFAEFTALDNVERGEFGKRLHDLEGARQAESRRLIGLHPGDVLAVERYNPRARRCHAAD